MKKVFGFVFAFLILYPSIKAQQMFIPYVSPKVDFYKNTIVSMQDAMTANIAGGLILKHSIHKLIDLDLDIQCQKKQFPLFDELFGSPTGNSKIIEIKLLAIDVNPTMALKLHKDFGFILGPGLSANLKTTNLAGKAFNSNMVNFIVANVNSGIYFSPTTYQFYMRLLYQYGITKPNKDFSITDLNGNPLGEISNTAQQIQFAFGYKIKWNHK